MNKFIPLNINIECGELIQWKKNNGWMSLTSISEYLMDLFYNKHDFTYDMIRFMAPRSWQSLWNQSAFPKDEWPFMIVSKMQ